MKRAIIILLIALMTVPGIAQEAPREKAEESLKKGAEYLIKSQNENGSFGKAPSPAVAALCAIALKDTPNYLEALGFNTPT